MAKRAPKPNLGRHFIRQWRKKRGLSLRALADRMELEPGGELLLSHASLGRIEQGKQAYTEEHLEALAEALNCETWELLHVNPEKAGEVVDLLDRIRQLDGGRLKRVEEFVDFIAAREDVA